jgi:excisionase family DNA binding protein
MLDDPQKTGTVLLTIPDAARRLSVHPRTVKRAIQAGDLPVVLLNDRQRGRRVALDDLEAFVAARRAS